MKYPLAKETPKDVIDLFVEYGPDILALPSEDQSLNERVEGWELRETKQLTIPEYKELYENRFPGDEVFPEWYEERGIKFVFLVTIDLLDEDGEKVVMEELSLTPATLLEWHLDRL